MPTKRIKGRRRGLWISGRRWVARRCVSASNLVRAAYQVPARLDLRRSRSHVTQIHRPRVRHRRRHTSKRRPRLTCTASRSFLARCPAGTDTPTLRGRHRRAPERGSGFLPMADPASSWPEVFLRADLPDCSRPRAPPFDRRVRAGVFPIRPLRASIASSFSGRYVRRFGDGEFAAQSK